MEDFNEGLDYQCNSHKGQNEIEEDPDSPVLIAPRPQHLERPRKMMPGKTYRPQLLYNSEMPDCYRPDTMAPHGGCRQGNSQSYREDSLMMVESEPPFRMNRNDTDYPYENLPSTSRASLQHHRDPSQHFQSYPSQAQYRPPTLNSGHPLDHQSQAQHGPPLHNTGTQLNSHTFHSNLPRSYAEIPEDNVPSRIYPKFLEASPPFCSSDLQTYPAANAFINPDRDTNDFGGNDSSRRSDINFGNASNFGNSMPGPSWMGPSRGDMEHNSGDLGLSDNGLVSHSGSNRGCLQGASVGGRNRSNLQTNNGGHSRVGLLGPPDGGLLGQSGPMHEARAMGQTALPGQTGMMVNSHRNLGDAYNTRSDAQIRHPSDHVAHTMTPISRGGPTFSNHQGNTIQGNRQSNTRFPPGHQEGNIRFTNNQSNEARFRLPQNNQDARIPNEPGTSSFPNPQGNSRFPNQQNGSRFPHQQGNASSKFGEENGPSVAKKPRLLPLPKVLEDKSANYKKDVKDDKSECSDLKVMVTHVDLASIWYHNMRVANLRSAQFMLQVVGRLESVRVKPHHKTIIIRHPSQHTALQCIFYEIDRKFPPIVIGSIIIVSGHMIGEKMMKIFDVEQIYESEIQKLHRLVFLSERQIKDIFDSRTGDGQRKI